MTHFATPSRIFPHPYLFPVLFLNLEVTKIKELYLFSHLAPFLPQNLINKEPF
jgi:hypothetical protein